MAGGDRFQPLFFPTITTLLVLFSATHPAASRATPATPQVACPPGPTNNPTPPALTPGLPTTLPPVPAVPGESPPLPPQPIPWQPSVPAVPAPSPPLPPEPIPSPPYVPVVPAPSPPLPPEPIPSLPPVPVVPAPSPALPPEPIPSLPPEPAAPAPLPGPSPSKGIKGAYWPSWKQWTFPPSSIAFSYFTHVFYAFVQPDASTYELIITYDDQQALPNFTATLHSQDPPLKALLSIGGWNPASPFPQMASSASNRAAFIRSSIAVARKYGLDGLDLDWEYPQDPQQMEDLAQLYKECRAAIEQEALQTGRPPLLLTSAVYFSSNFFLDPVQRSYPVDAMRETLDLISPMCFDYHGGWNTSVTGAHAALYDPNTNVSTSYGVESWLAAGMPPEKVAMGLPVYGRTWTLKDPAEHGIGAPAVSTGPGPSGVLTYTEVVDQNIADRATVVYDSATVSIYSYAGTVWIGYDDPRSVEKKVKYARRLGLGGYFFWALSFDRNWTISSAAWHAWGN